MEKELKITTLSKEHKEQLPLSLIQISEFLFRNLDQYGDPKEHIMACLNYVFEKGGAITIGMIGNDVAGVVITNETGMKGYIPEYILVYIAVSPQLRGQGIGRKLMEEVINKTPGAIALHVEPDNPARRLYENLGFTNKYLEMRLTR